MCIRPQRDSLRYQSWMGLALAVTVVMVVVLLPAEAWAGPGGAFVKAIAKSWWAKVGLVLLAVIFLPVLVWVWFAERRAIGRTQKLMAKLAPEFPEFDWGRIRPKLSKTIDDVYRAWSTGDLSSVQQAFYAPYFDAQQDLLARWKEEGKRNHLEFKNLNKVVPLRVELENEDNFSMIYVIAEGQGVDYLERISDKKVLKGSHKSDDLETIWTFVWVDGAWRVAGIDDGSESLAIAGQPAVHDTSFLRRTARRVPSEMAPAHAMHHRAMDDEEESVSGVSDRQQGNR